MSDRGRQATVGRGERGSGRARRRRRSSIFRRARTSASPAATARPPAAVGEPAMAAAAAAHVGPTDYWYWGKRSKCSWPKAAAAGESLSPSLSPFAPYVLSLSRWRKICRAVCSAGSRTRKEGRSSAAAAAASVVALAVAEVVAEMSSEASSVPCSLCEATFGNPRELGTHILTAHCEDANGGDDEAATKVTQVLSPC